MYIFDGQYYDNVFKERSDIKMYKKLALEFGSEILEIGIGTGRVGIELAKEGHSVTGIDFSEEMMKVGKAKAELAGVEVTFYNADMRDFNLQKQFDMIIIPINTITHLLTFEDIKKFFHSVRTHLKSEGRFIIDYFNPNFAFLPNVFSQPFVFNQFHNPNSNALIEVIAENKYHCDTQITEFRLSYRQNGSEIKQGSLEMRIFYPQELKNYLMLCGFAIEAHYGDYECNLFNEDSKRNIIIALKSE